LLNIEGATTISQGETKKTNKTTKRTSYTSSSSFTDTTCASPG
jgi:hypothetical protein